MDVILAGDFNRPPMGSPLARVALDLGYRSLSIEEEYDFISCRSQGKNDNMATSLIDDVLVSGSLSELFTHLSGFWPRQYGHLALHSQLRLENTCIAFFKLVMPTVCLEPSGTADWQCGSKEPPVLWLHLCHCLDSTFDNKQRRRGSPASFRKRAIKFMVQGKASLQQAFEAQDYAAVGRLLSVSDLAVKNAIKLWLSRLRHSSANIWTSTTARWVRKASVPLPLSIEVNSDHGTFRTVGLAEMHNTAFDFYHQLYNVGDVFQLPSRRSICADVYPADFSPSHFSSVLGRVILKASPNRPPGLDGTYVSDYKLMPPEGL